MALPLTNLDTGLVADGRIFAKFYGAAFAERFKAAIRLYPLCNRRYEASMQNREQGLLRRDKSTISVTENQTGMDYPTTGYDTAAIEAVPIQWGQSFWTGFKAQQYEVASMDIDILTVYANRRADEFARIFDAKIAKLWNNQALGSVTNDYSTPSTTTDQQIVLGTATNYVPKTSDSTHTGGIVAGADADADLVYNRLLSLKLELEQANKSGNAAQADRQWTLVCEPHIYNHISRSIAGKGVDSLILEQIEGRERRLLFGTFDLVSSNLLESVSHSSKTHSPIYIITSEATTVGRRFTLPVYRTPAENQLGWYHKLDMTGQSYELIDDVRFMYRILVRQEA